MPNLRTLKLHDCWADDHYLAASELPEPRVRVRELVLGFLSEGQDREGLMWWIRLLSTEVTEVVSIPCPIQTVEFLRWLAEEPRQSSLQSIVLSPRTPDSPYLAQALSQCPQLKVLHMVPYYLPRSPDVTLSSATVQAITKLAETNSLRSLQDIAVPSELALPFLLNCPIERLLTRWVCDEHLAASMVSVIKDRLPGFTYLKLFGCHPPISWLGDLLACPHLEEAYIWVENDTDVSVLDKVGVSTT